MISKVQEREKAIKLRKIGYSYRDILKEVNVAKSTLSLWLKGLPLTKEEKTSLKKRKNNNISRGRINAGAALRRRRLERESLVFEEAEKEFKERLNQAFFHTGIALYWGEGAKRSNFFAFTNSDPDMMILMTKWIERYLDIKRSNFSITLYIHKPYAHENHEDYWSEVLKIPKILFKKTVCKSSVSLVKKRPNYKGCLRIVLPRSKSFLLRMLFWQKMIFDFN